MSTVYDTWLGREEERAERIQASVAAAMAATIDLDAAPGQGQPLPPGWQWLYFNPAARRSGLGVDGHPQRGGFLPPIELPRRMWAGSRIRYLSPLPVDGGVTKHSRIAKIENKTGKRGALWFVTVAHTFRCDGRDCIAEEQDIVYREATPVAATGAAGAAGAAATSAAGSAAPAPKPEPYAGVPSFGREFRPDTTLLFRYSALTFNGHRIHYDQAYARGEEGYPDLVVHGPLTATLLQQLAVEQGGGRRLARFDFRGVAPLFVSRPFRLEGKAAEGGGLELWARGPDGELAMSATAAFE